MGTKETELLMSGNVVITLYLLFGPCGRPYEMGADEESELTEYLSSLSITE